MPLREAFAANLSRLCEGEVSIAAVCRATRINRQQFNRYLTGDALPNRRNLAKICRYFSIEESDLFRAIQAGTSHLSVTNSSDSLHANLQSALTRVQVDEKCSLPSGIYYAHFAIPDEPNSIMRSTVVVRNEGNMTTFRRLTLLCEPKGSWWSYFFGDHGGVVLERLHWLYFVGINSRGHQEPTLLVMRWTPVSRPMLVGQAMIITPSGPTVTAAVLNRCSGNTTLRRAIKSSHVYAADDPALDPVVLDKLDEQCSTLTAMTRHLDLSVRSLSKPSRASVAKARLQS